MTENGVIAAHPSIVVWLGSLIHLVSSSAVLFLRIQKSAILCASVFSSANCVHLWWLLQCSYSVPRHWVPCSPSVHARCGEGAGPSLGRSCYLLGAAGQPPAVSWDILSLAEGCWHLSWTLAGCSAQRADRRPLCKPAETTTSQAVLRLLLASYFFLTS